MTQTSVLQLPLIEGEGGSPRKMTISVCNFPLRWSVTACQLRRKGSRPAVTPQLRPQDKVSLPVATADAGKSGSLPLNSKIRLRASDDVLRGGGPGRTVTSCAGKHPTAHER